jgi:3-oxoadipate enol-lactonase
METTDRTIEVSTNTKIHVSISGSNTKTSLVFLHFWGGSSRTWSKVIPLLPSTKFQTIAIDFRGWGDSTGPSDPAAYTIDILATDIENVLHELGVMEYVLVGHSMGGKVAQVLAGRDKIVGLKGLVLVAPAPPGPLILPKEAREQQEHAYESAASADFVTRNVLTATKVSDSDVRLVVEDMTRGSAEAKAAWPAYGMAEDVKDVAKNITGPVVVIGAENDQVETVKKLKSEVLTEIEGSRLEVIQGCGHLIPIEAPQDLVGHLMAFLESISVVAST